MRQAGFLAAAALYAIENNIESLADDHKRTAEIGAVLATKKCIAKVEPYQTNILIFELNTDELSQEDFFAWLDKKRIRLISMGERKLRVVTHRDYTAEMHEYLLTSLEELS